MFGSITAQTVTYSERSPGEYIKTGLTFADPSDYFRLRAGSVRNDGLRTCGIVRGKEKDVTIAGQIVRKNAVISINILVPNDSSFTATELDSLMSDCSEFATATTISEMLQGKN